MKSCTRQFTRGEIQMANKNMTKYFPSLVIKEIKIKETDVIPCFSDKTEWQEEINLRVA